MSRFFLLFFFVSLFFGCQNSDSKENLISSQIEYWVEIGNPVAEEYDRNWLNKDKRLDFLKDILKKAKHKELPVYYYMPDTLIPLEDENLDMIFQRTDTIFIENEFGEVAPVPIREELDLDAIVRLKFLEQWYFNKRTNEFTKKVKAISPMVEVYKNEKEILGYKGLFWIYLNQEK